MRFRFRLVPFLATCVLVAIGVSAGQWQDRRAAAKLALQAELQARAEQAPVDLNRTPAGDRQPDFQPVRVRGTFVAGYPVYLENRQYQGRPGFYVLMPLRLADSERHVLVARGWLPRDPAARERIAPYPTPAGEITLTGVAHGALGHALALGQDVAPTAGAIVLNAGWQEVATASRLAFEPLVLEQRSDTGDGLVRDWPAPNVDINKHRGYAFQWYALAVAAILYFIITGFRSGRKESEPQK
ncbi:SURF1 family protein [Massilia sp. TS11]|uniref:SURF1 family protein n=1 Tax=Massilia sp. TS11 TaxID=2908003 RepID=UPI001EDB5831|nr:SURF1 family protein [Massilia sp. TS11]MCG2585357.1 SURF1 family protein [Massilia sp. TS11]